MYWANCWALAAPATTLVHSRFARVFLDFKVRFTLLPQTVTTALSSAASSCSRLLSFKSTGTSSLRTLSWKL